MDPTIVGANIDTWILNVKGELPHTAATLLLLQGIHPKVVSEMLGHPSVAIMLDLYSHVLPDMQRDAMQAMERIHVSISVQRILGASTRSHTLRWTSPNCHPSVG